MVAAIGQFLAQALRTAGLLLGIVTLVFLGVRAAPGDPIDHLLGETATEAERSSLRHQLHLDGPLWQQFGAMLGEIGDGTLGTSRAVAGQPVPVSGLIIDRLPSTLALALASLAAAIAFALPLGIIGACWRGRWPDHLARIWSLLGVSLPAFVSGPLAIFVFAVVLRWAPTPAHDAHPLAALALPALVIGFALSGRLARLLRSSLVEALGSDMANAWRARGADERRVLWRHAVPNALLPVVTLLGLQLAALLGGALVTEKIFGRKGLGTLLLDGIAARDHAVVQGCVLTIGALYVLAMHTSGAMAAWLDPRLRRPAADP